VKLGRRHFLGSLVASFMGVAGFLMKGTASARDGLRLRPPGALAEGDFLSACARCFRCGNACPNQCIQFSGLEDGLENAFSPFIKARERACILCGECTKVCPTGALKEFGSEREDWVAQVDMGTARVNESMCFSFNMRTCGACYRACPLAGEAMTIGVFETPNVHPESCVGCGLCEQACLHLPQAIRVVPRSSGGTVS
jgi:ferredoxin-type protein NapG